MLVAGIIPHRRFHSGAAFGSIQIAALLPSRSPSLV